MAKAGIFIKAVRGVTLSLDLATSFLSRRDFFFFYGIYRRSMVYNRTIDYSLVREQKHLRAFSLMRAPEKFKA